MCGERQHCAWVKHGGEDAWRWRCVWRCVWGWVRGCVGDHCGRTFTQLEQNVCPHCSAMGAASPSMLSKHTGQPFERIAHDSDRDFYMDALAAKEYGIVDEILTRETRP